MSGSQVLAGRHTATWVAITLAFGSLAADVAAQPGTITTVAGGGPGTMPAIQASLRGNVKVVSDAAGNLYVSDGFAHRVYRFDRSSGILSPFAGTGFRGDTGDGGPAVEARLENPYGLALDEPGGTLYIQDGRFVRAVHLASGTISRFAGNGGGGALADGMPPTQAPIAYVADIAVDAAGVVYFASDTGGWRIWAVENGLLHAVAGNGVARGSIDGPGGDPADDYQDGVPATSASLGSVSAVTVAGQGLYFYEQAALALGGARYRRVDLATGTLTTYAGNGYVYGSYDGPGNDPRDDVVENAPALQSALAYTTALTADPVSGDFYGLVYTIGLVRRVSSNGDGTAGTVLTVAGGGPSVPTSVSPLDAALRNPTGLSRDADGKLYVAAGTYYDFDGYAVYGATPVEIAPVVGNGYEAYCGDGGPASAACLLGPIAARPDGAGQLLIGEEANQTVRSVDPGGTISSLIPRGGPFDGMADLWPLGGGTFLFSIAPDHSVYRMEPPYSGYTWFAGTGEATGSIDGEGGDPSDDLGDGELAWVASLNTPAGLARDAQGSTFIADTGNHRVRRIDAVTGVISTVAGTGTPGDECVLGSPATATDFLTPHGLAFAPNGDLLVSERDAHRVRRIQAGADGFVNGEGDETVDLVAGSGPSSDAGFGGDGGPGAGAFLNTPTALAVDVLGHVYVADSLNHAIRRVEAQTGIIDTIAGRGEKGDGVPAVQSRLEEIVGLSTEVVGGRSYLYVTDWTQERVRRIDLGPAQGPENQPPVVQPLGLDGATPLATSPSGATVGLYASAQDPDGDTLTYTWSGPFGTVTGLGVAVRLPIGPSTVTVDVDDGHGHVVTQNATVTVLGENTLTGNGEIVTPQDDHEPRMIGETRGRVSVTFLGPVTTPGLTWFRTRTDQVPPPPGGRQLGSAPFYYDVATTAEADGDVRICLDLTGMSFAFPGQVELHRLTAQWSGLGFSPDPLTHVVCAQAPFAETFGTYANFTPADPATLVATVAGTGQAEDTGDGGPADQAGLNIPEGLAFDRTRNLLYIGEGSHRVRRVNLTDGRIETIAGTGAVEDPVDGIDARLSSIGSIAGLALDADGHLFVGDTSHCLIRRVDLDTNVITTVAGSWRGAGLTCGRTGDNGPAIEARIGFAHRLAFDAEGNLLFAEMPTLGGESGGFIRRVAAGPDHRITGDDPAETITTVAGNGTQDLPAEGAHPLDAGLFPRDLDFGPDGGLYVATNDRVLRVAPGADAVVDGSADEAVTLVLGDPNGWQAPFQADGGAARSAYAAFPSGLAVLPSGDVLVADAFLRRIRRISAGGDGAVDGNGDERIVTIAGFSDDSDPAAFNGDGYALSTRLAWPAEIAVDGAGGAFVADSVFQSVRRFGVSSGDGGGAQSADLALSATAAPDPVAANATLTLDVSVTNHGPGMAHAVRVSFPLPETATFVSSTPAGWCEPDPVAAGSIVCNLGDLAAGSTTSVLLDVRPTTPGPLETTLSVSATEADPNSADNAFTVTATVTAPVPVVIEVNETILVSDAPGLTPSVMLTVPETILVADAVTPTPSVMLAVAEAVAVTDAPRVTASLFPTSVSLTSSLNPSVGGDSVTFTAAVGSSGGIPQGDVEFSYRVPGAVASFSLGTVALDPSGSTAVTTAGLGVGNLVVSARYLGSETFATGAAVLQQTVAPAPTTTSLASSAANAFTTRPPVFTATVATAAAWPAAGAVEFFADGTSLGRSLVFERGGAWIAVMGGATLEVGTHTISARYEGDGSHAASGTGPLTQNIVQGDYVTVDLAPTFTDPTEATAVNASDQVVGYSTHSDMQVGFAQNVGFLYSGGGLAPLGSLGGLSTIPVAINDSGQIVGVSTTSAQAPHAFSYEGGAMTDLGTLGGATSRAFAINAAGQVVGVADTAAGTHGFLYKAGTLTDLNTLGGSESAAIAINASGFAAGQAALTDETRRAAYYTTSWSDLGTLGGTTSRAVAINDAGQVAGIADLAGDLDAHAFLWHRGQMLDLAGTDGPASMPFALNDAGQVVGWTFDPLAWASHDASPEPLRAFHYSSGSFAELGTLSGGTSQARDISNAGLLVGHSDGRAFVSAGGALRDLGTLGGPSSRANAINDRGLIVGYADTASGLRHAVAWVPVPVPTLTVASATGPVGGTTTLTAMLSLLGLPATDQSISFSLNGSAVGSATTDATGTATLSAVSLAGLAEGTYPGAVQAAYAGVTTIVGATEATGDLTVTPLVDHSPVANDDVYTLGPGPLSIPAPGVLANDADPDGDALTAVLVSGPSHGTVTLHPDGSFAYTPGAGVAVGDGFTYRATGAGVPSNVATVSLAAGAIQPVFAGLVTVPRDTINDALGDQTEPHVSGDLLSYTSYSASASRIHYHRFSTGVDAMVPEGSPGTNDSLSDVLGDRIGFSRTLPDGTTASMLFDAGTSQVSEIDPRAGSTRFGVTLGGNWIAFADFRTGNGDVYAWDLGTSTSATVTPSPTTDQNPRLATDGSVLVFESCSGVSCDINKASRVGGAWVVAPMTSTPGSEGNPDTDGTWIVYDAAGRPEHPTGSGIYLRPAAGGPETRLAIPGDQWHPSISQGTISFEGGTGPGARRDVFVYVLASNTLYQITDTPAVHESWSDVTVLPDGRIRVVWAADDDLFAGINNIYAVTFTPGIQPVFGGLIGASPITINASAGDQDDPHVHGDLLSYTDNSTATRSLRHYDFGTGIDAVIPQGSGIADLLSDVSGQRVVFSRVMSDRTSAMLFDVGTSQVSELDPRSATARFGNAISGDTVAFVEANVGGGDIFVWDLASSTGTNVTASPETDENPSLSPDGSVLVWVRTAVQTGADIFMARKVGGVWGAPTPVAVASVPEENPDTDGTWVVYDSTRSATPTGRDICLRAVSGGLELRLALPGAQANPNISRGVISFESTPEAAGAKSDLFVYVIATNTYYQLTDTPTIGEHLNDVSVLPNGDVRVVWAADKSATDQTGRIHAMTFTPGAGAASPVAVASGSATICAGGSAPLAGSGGVSCSWSPGLGLDDPLSCTPVASPAVTTTYTLTVTDAQGQSSTNAPTVTVTVEPLPVAVASGSAAINLGQSAPLQGSGGVACSWSPAIGLDDPSSCSPLASPALTTTYTLTVTGGAGCTSIDAPTVTVTVVQPQRRLSVTKTGTGSGVVTSSPAGIACGTTCSALFDDATLVALTPAPNPNFVFGGWSGDPDCTDGFVTMGADKSCTAAFNRRPNLVVAALVSPAVAQAGATISITDTTRNAALNGGPAFPGLSTTRFHLSADNVLDPGDVVLGGRRVPQLGPAQSDAGTTSLTLPAGVVGSFFLIAAADADSEVTETNEGNNTRSVRIRIGADLRVTSLTAPARAGSGDTISVGDTTTNALGAAPAEPSRTGYFLSPDTVLDAADAVLGSRPVGPLAPGTSDAGTAAVTLPTGLSPGTWYLIAHADSEDAVAERDETDNTRSRRLMIR